MSGELGRLNPYAVGDVKPRRGERKVAGQARDIFNEGRLADLKEDVIFSVGTGNMQRASMLDMQRRVLSGGDPGLNTILADIELETLAQAKRIQQGLFRDDL